MDKIDPVTAMNMALAGTPDGSGVVLFFVRPVYTVGPQGIDKTENAPSAAVSVSWGVLKQIHEVIGSALDQREVAIAQATAPGLAAKPN